MCKHLVVLHICSAISFLSLESSSFLYSELHLSTRMFIWQLVNRQTSYSPDSAREWVAHLTRNAWTVQHWAEHSTSFCVFLGQESGSHLQCQAVQGAASAGNWPASGSQRDEKRYVSLMNRGCRHDEEAILDALREKRIRCASSSITGRWMM